MLSIRFHGRGGQGTVIASKLLANAFFREGWEVQAFPSFGAERSGAPVAAFLRADRRPITLHSQIYEPEAVVVLDPLLMRGVDVACGLRPDGWLLVNSGRPPSDFLLRADLRVATCDATAIAIEHGLGTRTQPIVNTAIAGAFAAFTRLVSLDAVLQAMPGVVPVNVDANRAAAKAAFERVALCEGVLAVGRP